MEFYRVADDLRAELSHFLMSEKNVPKKWRSVVTYPMLNMMQEFFDCMVEANGIYPRKEEDVDRRKALQQKCIVYCEKLYERMQYAMRVVWWERLHRNEENLERRRLEYHIAIIGDLLDKEEILLKGWHKSTKLLSCK